MTPLHQAALEYAQRGWFVFPCLPGEKTPATQHGHKEASRDPDQINAWWSRQPNANIGIAVAPSGLVTLDVDVAEGKPGAASLREIDSQLTDTLTQVTGRGGLHIVYTRPPDVQPQRRIGFRPGLDLIGEGYIVAAPSVLSSGGQYRWNRTIAPAPLPEVLRSAAVAPRAQEKVQVTGTPIPEGGRNQALFRLGCALRDTGIGREALARALDVENKQRVSPPLPDEEVANIVDSVLTRITTPARDVAIGAIVEEQVRAAVAPQQSGAQWLEAVSLLDAPPVQFFDTGIPELNALIGGGFATGSVVGLVAPPSTGKSSLVGQLLLTLSKFRPGLHCSTELPSRELMIRYVSVRKEIPWGDGLRGRIPKETLHAAVQGLPIKIMGNDILDRNDPLGHLEHEAREIHKQTGAVPFILVDYVQLLARGVEDKKNAVGALTERLRLLSQILDTVIIAVFSTGRGYYSGPALDKIRAANDPIAYLGAAKETGDIEFDCATMLFLDVDQNHEGMPKPARLAVARCRYGRIGFVGLRARLDIGRFDGDPSAAAEMASDEMRNRRQGNKLEAHCNRLIEAIKKCPGRPWREICKVSGLSGGDASAAQAKLIENGVVQQADRYEYGRKATGYTLVLVQNVESPTNAVPESDGHED